MWSRSFLNRLGCQLAGDIIVVSVIRGRVSDLIAIHHWQLGMACNSAEGVITRF